MLCRKCFNPIDLNQPGLTCKNCGYDNIKNPEHLPNVDINTTKAFDTSSLLTCPKCGGHNIEMNPPTVGMTNTVFSPMNALLGACCCGFPGCLLGLTGDRRLKIDNKKTCKDCGTIFE